MKPDSLVLVIFSKPRLVALIAHYLGPHDIAQCSAVCKDLARQLEPFLWRDFYAVTAFPPPWTGTLAQQPSTLLRVRCHLQSIEIAWNGVLYLAAFADGLSPPAPAQSASSPSSVCAQPVSLELQSLTIHHLPDFNRSGPQNILSIARHCPHLTTLNVPSLVLAKSNTYHKLLLRTISDDLPNLKQLALLGMSVIEWKRVASFLDVCFQHPQLTALKCWFSLSDSLPLPLKDSFALLLQAIGIAENTEASHDQDQDTMKFSSCSKINDFRLPLFPDRYPIQYLLAPMLKYHGPRLEHLGLPSLPSAHDESVAQVIAEYCPKLCHFSLNMQDVLVNRSMFAILDSLRNPGLVSFSLSGTSNQLWLTIVISLLAQSHSSTLQEITIKGSNLDQAHLHHLLHDFPTLKKLLVSLPDTGSDIPLVQSVPKTADWGCLELKEFIYCYDADNHWSSHVFLKEVGRLVQLEVLGIGSSGKFGFGGPLRKTQPTALTHGWLEELEGLKKLRHLFFMTDLSSTLDQEEVEFMHWCWPHLEKITFGFQKAPLDEIVKQPHWQWLKKQRPWIQYTYWNDSSGYIAKNL
ncbi:hypothetical protein B0O80DRAFT_502456 [Mortierella sp. GBAus27b]|nr:hypothetical protein BGX31_007643 [Mortierella sp. GBA43]KAI8347813.1 hypothetical protein B0O80DRAFT_502456 [Mortierella sp. GBAus27b]